ncbi:MULTISPECIES: hypothetical protein [Aeromonas]|uniref:hypothetical protein n=1 Tax=Aeromonas TaxID=642 RepID=UPI000537484E|nr:MULTISPECIES: hypothetical protein [Aeromonas]AUU20753.1 hypothetical protein MC60_001345 [Aeromonas caviae]QOK17784.1 hypothetical protein IL332_11870 [Aeromonas caviae]BBQ26423.1 hypothetical protein WP2W18C05_26390 [Aeromonas sp. WP2-W18-CRE-05]
MNGKLVFTYHCQALCHMPLRGIVATAIGSLLMLGRGKYYREQKVLYLKHFAFRKPQAGGDLILQSANTRIATT